MTLYQIEDDSFTPLSRTGFRAERLRERHDLQRLLRDQIEIIDDSLLVLAEEYGNWQDSRRRVDLLCIDRDANLTVVELKRTNRGGHMELQAIRYAAMVSEMTFEQAVQAHAAYLTSRGLCDSTKQDKLASDAILEHLGWDDSDEDGFNQDVRIVLASQDFGTELTSAVLWLIERDIDIRCVRLRPYRQEGGPLILEVQPIIPLPEAADYQVRVREKRQSERATRSGQSRQRIRLTIADQTFDSMAKRRAVLRLFRTLVARGMSPEQIAKPIDWRKDDVWKSVPGKVDSAEFIAILREEATAEGRRRDPKRSWFWEDDQLVYHNGATWAVAKMWRGRTLEALQLTLLEAREQLGEDAVADIEVGPQIDSAL